MQVKVDGALLTVKSGCFSSGKRGTLSVPHLTSLLPRQTYKFSECSFSEMALTNFEVPACLFHETGSLTMHIG